MCWEGITTYQEAVRKVLLGVRKVLLGVRKVLLGVWKVVTRFKEGAFNC